MNNKTLDEGFSILLLLTFCTGYSLLWGNLVCLASISGLYPLGALGTSLVMTSQNISRHYPKSLVGSKIVSGFIIPIPFASSHSTFGEKNN